jgi:hypothetical protein
MLASASSGFSLDALVRIAGHERAGPAWYTHLI